MSSKIFMHFPAFTVTVAHVAGMLPVAAFAETPAGVAAATGNTQVYLAPNGVPIVNIANPNAGGLSHNQYTQFNVDARGVVLNNGDASQLTRQSQLAGQTLANVNLVSQAKVILNEVVSPNRSTLAGFTEVLGGKADVIVANPFGITCNGCGFINTDRVSLTTGTPQLDANGNLNGFRVNGGDILVSGPGLNANGQSYFDLVTRSLKVDGQINAHNLNVVTGSNDWNYATGEVTSIAGDSTVPDYAFDSTALGGIYADRIRIVATEAGVGVRNLGDVAATADDFSIDAAGRIELKGHVSAQRDLKVRYGSTATSADAITVGDANASLTAARDLDLDAGGAGVTLGDGTLTANAALNVAGNSLQDNGSALATRFGGANVAVNIAGATTIADSSWGSAGNLDANVGSLMLTGNSARLYGANVTMLAGSGDLSLGTATLQSTGNILLGALGSVLTSGASGHGVLAANNVSISAAALENHGDVLAGNELTVASSNVQNTGALQATNAVLVTADSVDNTGKVLAGTTLTVASAQAVNSGRIQATNNVALITNSLNNSGIVLADGSLSLLANVDATNSGTLQATGNATFTTASLNNTGTVLSKAALDIGGDQITNAGTLQASATAVLTGTALNNTGQVLAGAALVVNAAVVNPGLLQATGDVTLNATSLQNDGKVLAGDALTISTAGLQNTGTLQSTADASVTATTLTNSNSGQLLAGNKLTLAATSVQNSGRLQAVNGAQITAASLTNAGATSRILTATTGTGAGVVTIADTLTNEGAIHGNGNLQVRAGTLQNAGTGGITSSTVLALTSTSGGINNQGALYATNQLNVTATGQTVINTLSGTIDAGNLTVNAGTFTNYNTVIVDGTAAINTTIAFNNLSGYSRAALVGTNVVYTADGGEVGHVCHGGSNLVQPCSGNDSGYAEYWMYSAFIGTQEAYLINPATLKKPQIIAGTRLDINIAAGTGHNQTGLIAAPLVNISGTGTFTNEDLHLDAVSKQLDWTHRYQDSGGIHTFYTTDPVTQQEVFISDPNALGPFSGLYDQYFYETGRTTLPVPGNLGAGIYATTLNFSNGLTVNNVGSTAAQAKVGSAAAYLTPSTPLGASGVGGIDPLGPVNGASSIPGSTLTISLPTNPNGRFIVSPDPQSHYLIETNPLFGADGAFGSDYLAKLLGYNVDTLGKRLGDANYEQKLVRDQLIAQTGRNIVNGYASEKDQMQALMNSAASQSTTLGLEFGKPLSSEQVSRLQGDLVWMVEQVVSGQTVLVPVVYLSSTTRQQIESGAVLQATNLNFNGNSLTNSGGKIVATEQLNVTTQGDIVNQSGKISGGSVLLTSQEGSIRNETATNTVVGRDSTNTMVGETGTITSTGDMSLNAKKDVVVKGAAVNAGGNASITAGDNVVIDTVQDTTRTTSRSDSVGIGSTSATTVVTTDVKQIGSSVSAGGNVKIKSGNDVTLGGSTIKAGGNASVDAGRDVNIVDRTDTHSVETSTESSGFNSSGSRVSFDNTTTTNVNTTGTSVGSSVTAGGNVDLNAARTVTVKGSDVAAGGDLNVKAKDINVVAGENTTYDATHTESTGWGIGGHADANSTGWDISHQTTTSDKVDTSSTARTSSLKAGGDINRTATGTITDVGTQIEAGGNVKQSATTITSRAAENTTTSTSSSVTETESFGPSIDYGVGDAINDAKNGSTAGAVSASSGPSVGNTFTYKNDSQSASSATSKAVTGSIKAGGKVTSTSTGTTTFEGTQIQSGGDTDIAARTLNMNVAKDTSSSTSSSTYIEASARGEIDSSGKPGGKISGEYKTGDAHSESSTAVVGSVKSGGNVTLRTSGDTRLEGTAIQSKGDATVDAGGNVVMDAARTTSSSSDSKFDAKGSISVGKSSGAISGSLDTSSNSTNSSQAVTGSIDTGGNLTVHSGKDVTLEGTDLSAGKDVKIGADGKVIAEEAVSTSESESESFSGSISVAGNKGSKGARRAPSKDGSVGAVGGGVSSNSEKTSTTTTKEATVKAKGTVAVDAKQGAQLNNTDVKSEAAK